METETYLRHYCLATAYNIHILNPIWGYILLEWIFRVSYFRIEFCRFSSCS